MCATSTNTTSNKLSRRRAARNSVGSWPASRLTIFERQLYAGATFGWVRLRSLMTGRFRPIATWTPAQNVVTRSPPTAGKRTTKSWLSALHCPRPSSHYGLMDGVRIQNLSSSADSLRLLARVPRGGLTLNNYRHLGSLYLGRKARRPYGRANHYLDLDFVAAAESIPTSSFIIP
jgi:hypothetical protein